MSKLDPRIEAIRAKYDLSASDFWELPQKKGTWIAKHSALEIVAVKANIVWAMPQIVEAKGAEGVAAMIVMGTMGERSEWATGEASPKNNKNAYPWAMAEKRGKDRVVLKLSGIAGLVYSEDEADDFREPAKAAPAPSQAPSRDYLAELAEATPENIQTLFAEAWRSTGDSQKKDKLKASYEKRKLELAAQPKPGTNNFDQIASGEVQ